MPVDPNFVLYQESGRTRIPLIAGVSGYPVENHRFGLSLTQYPTESGSRLSDNAVRDQSRLRLEGRVASIIPGFAPGEPQRVWARIFGLMNSRQPVLVVTRLRSYPNMMITRCDAPVDRTTGSGLRFTMELTEVLFANSQIVRFPPDAVDPNGPAAGRTSEVDAGLRNSPGLDENEIVSGFAGLSFPQGSAPSATPAGLGPLQTGFIP